MPLRRIQSTLILALLAMLTAAFACREEPPVLRVGYQGDEAFRRAIEIGIRDIEQSGSPVRVEAVYDDKRAWTPANAVSSTDAFCRDPDILAVIGFTNSDASLAAARIFNRHGIPQIIPTATSPKLVGTGEWTFRLCPNDEYQAGVLADTAWRRFGARRCAVVYQNSDYGRGLSELFRNEFEDLGGEVSFTALLGSGFTKPAAVELYARKIIELQPDLLVLLCQPMQADKMRKELARGKSALPMLGSDGMGTRKMRTELAGNFDGLVITLFYHPQLPFPGNAEFAEQFRRLNDGDPPGYESALAYDALMLLHQAVLEGARSREEVRSYLTGLSGEHEPFPGVAGPITFNSSLEVERPIHLGMLRNGELVLWPPGEPLQAGGRP